MKKTNFTGKVKADLVKALYDKREALSNFRFGSAGSKSKNVKEGSHIRKDIARILTELNK